MTAKKTAEKLGKEPIDVLDDVNTESGAIALKEILENDEEAPRWRRENLSPFIVKG